MDPFVGEIRQFGFNFAPTGWAMCNGQLLPISQNTALFSILGTTYGGDGKSTFALPNLQGCVPMGAGAGPGLSPRDLGETGGPEAGTLLAHEMPGPTHPAQCNGQLLPINQNQALFSLLGTMYGGNGQTTFALPDLRGRVSMHVGEGHSQGERAGHESVTLTAAEMPQHNHAALSNTMPGTVTSPPANFWARTSGGTPAHT